MPRLFMPRHIAVTIMSLCALSACMPQDDGLTVSAPRTLPVTHEPQAGVKLAECRPRDWQKLVGKKPAEARLPVGLSYRVMPRGTVVTRDYQENRLNIITGPDGRVIEATCG